MFHTWIGTDYGEQCLRCGVVLDYLNPDSDEILPIDERAAETARNLVPGCSGPKTDRAHHYVLEAEPVIIGTGADTHISRWSDILVCAYGDAKSSVHRWPASAECIGA